MKKIVVLLAGILLTSCSNDNKTKMKDKEELNKIFVRDSTKAIQDPLFRLDKDSIKKAYGEKFLDLRNIINKHDPIGLIANGAPDDEYEAEVKTIIVQLEDDKASKQQVHDLVYREFLRWFDDESTAGPKSSYKDLANEIFKWAQKTMIR